MPTQSKMVADDNSIPAALHDFFRSLAPEQLSSITEAIAAVIPVRSTSERRRSFVACNRRAMTTKRPLNGFIAYRAYYSPVFKGATQKVKSGFIRTMWGEDKKRSMWTLLGKAYSDLRDHHMEAITVDRFLAVAVPLLPIVPIDLYLTKMGWILTVDASGESVLMRSAKFNPELLAAEYPHHTNLSEQDIVEHCYRRGLVDRGRRQRTRQHPLRDALVQNGMMTDTDVGAMGGNAVSHDTPPGCGALALAVVPQTVTSPSSAESVSSSPVSHTQEQQLPTPTSSSATTPSLVVDNENEYHHTNLDYLTIEAVTADQQSAYARTNGAGLAALHFHPQISPPILGFDPRIVQDDFDPFNLDVFGFDLNDNVKNM
ncbi:hypothetical protein AYO21_11470 [Fonsecaea monophora]|uniref:Alpha box domain-containing protein n=1 Tax=Fonsecaea monophora TaxID=254056 RepID=A0A177EQV2_9EURO|nr:hypothetical protein AYO21_11470 [Fonsecaea monophora]OAG34384.1 hypothetical protein AYO21_11470 [Fonsecaea monophora]